MAQEPIEMILLKHWASYVAIPIWIMNAEGDLIYYNEPAESILGRRFDDAGEVSADRLSDVFLTTDPEGNPIPSSELPPTLALTKQLPAHRVVSFQAFDGSPRTVEVTAMPIVGQGDRHLGSLTMFWESE